MPRPGILGALLGMPPFSHSGCGSYQPPKSGSIRSLSSSQSSHESESGSIPSSLRSRISCFASRRILHASKSVGSSIMASTSSTAPPISSLLSRGVSFSSAKSDGGNGDSGVGLHGPRQLLPPTPLGSSGPSSASSASSGGPRSQSFHHAGGGGGPRAGTRLLGQFNGTLVSKLDPELSRCSCREQPGFLELKWIDRTVEPTRVALILRCAEIRS